MAELNLGYTFYRNNDKADDVDFGREIVNRAEHLRVDSSDYFKIEKSEKLVYETVYPSLTLGLGYAHDTSEKDDYKLGFMFDHTTGLPYISGSTVKGVLRSMFPFDKNDTERLAFINDLLGKAYSYDEMYELEKSIFGKKPKELDIKDNVKTKDVFYDGYFETKEGGFLASDNLTPHKDEITSPIPLRFLKIAPETKLVLQFELKENEQISEEERIKLYRGILSWTGLGAKSNVGYGELKEVLTQEEIAQREEEEIKREQDKKEANEKAKKEEKERAEAQRLVEMEELVKEKEQKKFEGLNSLLDCKTLADGFKLLGDSFGLKPELTEEEKKIVRTFKNRYKNLSKKDNKVFKKYGIL